jgi:CRISPR-associated protein Cmr6
MKANEGLPPYIPKYIPSGEVKNTPPGHRFLLYFNSDAEKLGALKDVCLLNEKDRRLIKSLIERQEAMAESIPEAQRFSITMKTTAPLATGLGNPHPVENGFAFMTPYGLPYLSGFSVKGVMRKAAEELALFSNSEWNIPLVWVLFGYDSESVYMKEPRGMPEPLQREVKRWKEAFNKWMGQETGQDILREWIKMYSIDDVKQTTKEIVEKIKSKDIHWQGLLCFWDAFFALEKDGLAVDIINPHYKDYYEDKGSPHEAGQPTPVFFLTIPPGTELTFYCTMLPRLERTQLSEKIRNWQSLLQEAFERAGSIGFGAKTSVGYGLMNCVKKEGLQSKHPRGGESETLLARLKTIKDQQSFQKFVESIKDSEIEALRNISFANMEYVINIGLVPTLENSSASNRIKKIIAEKMLEVIRPTKKWTEEKRKKYKVLNDITNS